ncbi:acyltransferase family protein [Candidatus Arsenophonus triatominarum]|uniref:acyltransferase family protein n=1 Tax=Candidatus Arsenophonus triatominarum TaxID=57911 RepID=UPI000AA346FB|nr:acyltransferase [Candidatus Arsenophonus triatominarum]
MNNKKLDAIQFLRGISVLLVIAFHFRQYLNNVYLQVDIGDRLFGLGEVGVDIFFVISGFVIVYSSINKKNNTTLEFSLKRFFKLYPVYCFVLLLLIIFNINQNYTASQIIKSFIYIPNDYNFIGPWYGYSINIPAWTLTYEVIFYAIFAAAIFMSHKRRTTICIFMIIIIVCTAQMYFRGFLQLDPITRDIDNNNIVRNLTFLSNPILYEFIYGMIIAEFYVRVNERISNNIIFNIAMVSIFWVSVVLIISGYNRGSGLGGLYSFALVGSLILLCKNKEINFGKFWLMMGEMSYSLYINHMVVKKLSGIYLRDLGIYNNNGGVTLFIILFILTFVMSYSTYNLIEKPSVNFGRRVVNMLIQKNRS